INTQLMAAGIAALDAQNLQNVLCEFDKYERDRESGKPSRKYQSAETVKPVATKKGGKKPKREPVATSVGPPPVVEPALPPSASVAAKAPDISTKSRDPPAKPAMVADAIPAHILSDVAQPPPPTNTIQTTNTRPRSNGGYPPRGEPAPKDNGA